MSLGTTQEGCSFSVYKGDHYLQMESANVENRDNMEMETSMGICMIKSARGMESSMGTADTVPAKKDTSEEDAEVKHKSSPPVVQGGEHHGDARGGHALLGARPKEVGYEGGGQVPYNALHEAGAAGYHGGGHAHYSALHVAAGDEDLQEVRRRAVGDEDNSIPGLWNGLW